MIDNKEPLIKIINAYIIDWNLLNMNFSSIPKKLSDFGFRIIDLNATKYAYSYYYKWHRDNFKRKHYTSIDTNKLCHFMLAHGNSIIKTYTIEERTYDHGPTIYILDRVLFKSNFFLR